MIVTSYGYTGYTGQGFDAWITGTSPLSYNNLFFSGVYVDLTGIDGRILDLELDMLNKVDYETTYTDFANLESTLRSQMNTRISALETTLADIRSALNAIRRTLRSYETRISALE